MTIPILQYQVPPLAHLVNNIIFKELYLLTAATLISQIILDFQELLRNKTR